MTIEKLRLNEQAKNHLTKLSRHTKISHRNVLCRWALCLSLAEPTVPPDVEDLDKPAIEIPWRIFGGNSAELYIAMLTLKAKEAKWAVDLQKLLTQHVHRGLGYMAGESKAPTVVHQFSRAV